MKNVAETKKNVRFRELQLQFSKRLTLRLKSSTKKDSDVSIL